MQNFTTEIEIRGDDKEIGEDDSNANNEDETCLHESLHRGLVHAVAFS